MTWIEPDGTPHSLSDPATVGVLVGPRGLGMPPVNLIEDRVPLAAGARLRAVVVGPRVVDLPLLVQATDAAALRSRLRDVLRWFDPTRGDGRLRHVAEDGTTRDLVCRYAGGLELAMELDQSYWITAQQVVVTLRAADPYWRDAAATALGFTLTAPASFFPFFPFRLTASTVFASAPVVNPGDADAYPIWTLTGPGSGIALHNLTTGESLSLTTVLAPGDVVTIDTTPGVRSVVRNDGADLRALGHVVDGSVLWSLPPGSSDVQLLMNDSTGASALVLAYFPRYVSV